MALNDKTMNKEQTQKRILLATVISFAFFIAYDLFYLQPKQELVNQTNAQNKQVQQQTTATDVSKGLNQAPAATQTTANQAPISKDITASSVISTITTQKNIFEFIALECLAACCGEFRKASFI